MKSSIVLILVNLFLLLTDNYQLRAQQITFNTISSLDELSFGVITGITQDRQGYIWFSTTKGLYKYDGYTLTNFKNNPINPNSLANNHTECIYIDEKNKIWIGTLGSGLDRFDPATNVFTHYRFNKDKAGSLSNDTVTVLLKDREGTFWIGTHGGLNKWDQHTNKFTSFRKNAKDPASLSSNQVRAIYEDRQGTLWIGTGSAFPADGGLPNEGGLNKMDKKTGKFIRYIHDPKNPRSLINNKVRAIFEDSRGTFWVGTKHNGLHIMDRKKGTFTRLLYDPKNPERLSRPYLKKGQVYEGGISFIQEDASGAIWIGAWIGGLNRYNPITREVAHFEITDTLTAGFKDEGSWCAFTSRDGIFWIGTNGGHLYNLDPLKKDIPHYTIEEGIKARSFTEDASRNLWIGTDSGLFKRNGKTGKIERFVTNLGEEVISNKFPIYSLHEDPQKRLWVGSDGGGLSVLTRDRQKVQRYKHNQRNKNSLSNDLITKIYEDDSGNFWIGTFKGLNKIDADKKTITRYYFSKDTATISPNTITSILKAGKDELWIGCWVNGGLHKLNQKNGKFKTYLNGTSIYSTYIDKNGILWVGGDDGLYSYRSSADVFVKFIDPSTSPGINTAGSIIEDDEKNLWLATKNGIIKVNKNRLETSIFDKNFGVLADSLDYFSIYKIHNGSIYVGVSKGFYAFQPNQLTPNPKKPLLNITSFRIGDQIVKPNKYGILKRPLSETEQINLNYDENVFSFDFVVLDYTNPLSNRIIYMLENFDNTWRREGIEGRAYYFNVPPGKYILHLKGSNAKGVWAEKAISINISPPWWKTWWAYLLFVLFTAGCIWAFIYYRSRSLILEKRQLEQKVNIRTAEVVKQKEEIARQRDDLEQALLELKSTQTQLIQSEKMASLGELTAGIAHEIQNPLNFVNNFSEVSAELIDDMEKELEEGDKDDAMLIAVDIRDNLKKIIAHGKRADSIVKGMLLHSRNSTGRKELVDINILVEEYARLSYYGLRAKDKSFNAKLETKLDPTAGKVEIIPQDLGRVLLNLLNNAFYSVSEKRKQRKDDYKPIVQLCTKRLIGKVEIRIKDNGLGIPKRVLDKIYEPFFTTKPTGQGTGLGLSLSYEIITKGHKGELDFETKEGEFAEFIIRLPA